MDSDLASMNGAFRLLLPEARTRILLALLNSPSDAGLRVSELEAHADIHRSTFYRHYNAFFEPEDIVERAVTGDGTTRYRIADDELAARLAALDRLVLERSYGRKRTDRDAVDDFIQ